MNTLIKLTVAILICLTGSMLWMDNASGAKPTAEVKVDAFDPGSALQGQDLDLTISGSGFDAGSTVELLEVTTGNASYVVVVGEILFIKEKGNAQKLIAPIHVLNAAPEGNYEVWVTTSGRRGKGTDSFTVKQAGGGGGSAEKVFAVKVTFNDDPFDTIKSDSKGSYFDFEGSGVGAQIPVEFSPPGQFTMFTKLAAIRHLFIDFGAAVDCAGAVPGTLSCVTDKVDDSMFTDPVPCLFPLGKRFNDQGGAANDQCSGYKLVTLGFRHTVDDSGAEFEYMLGMVNGVTFDGEGDNIEIDLREESKKEDDLRIRFDAKCLGLDKGDFLKITAWDNVDSDGIPNDEWRIDTIETDPQTDPEGVIITTTKTACLTRKGKGQQEDIVGLFDMQFGYTICILANQNAASAADGACLGEP